MSLVNHNLNNLAGGVSRQPEEARFDNQVEDMVNFEPYVTGSIRKRNPLEPIAVVDTHEVNTVVHSYDRGDGLEKYIIKLNDNGLKVYDTNGMSKTINLIGSINPLTKWGSLNWEKDVSFLTVGDTTWILNKKQTVEMLPDLSPEISSTTNMAFFWIKRSFDDGQGKGYTYTITLAGTAYSINSTSTTTAASSLASTLISAGYTVKVEGSVMKISRATPFTFSYGDSWGDQATKGWVNSVAKITELPSDMEGFTSADVGIIEVTGTDRNEFTSYYLKWEGDRWAETMASGLKYKFDSTTLPAKLVRVSDGSFTFGFNDNHEDEGFYTDWKDRTKGDDDSNVVPSFVGTTLSNMFFFRNRLGFTSEENVILSEVGDYYNFFATTVIETLDGDPIDVSVDSDTVTNIRNVNAVAGSLTLWADNAQFVLSGGEVLSPTTTRVAKTSSYSCDNSITPVIVDNEVLFFNKLGNNIDVLAYSASSLNTDTSSAESIATNVMGYLPSTITKAVVASGSNLVFLLDSADSKILYVYKYHINKNEKILSSWFKWSFDYDVKDICILGNELYLFINSNNLAKIELSIKDLDSTFLDMGLTTYKSEVLLSKYNIETKQGNRIIREPFYLKNIKVSSEGVCDLEVINEERNNVKLIKNKHIGRRLFIGGNSNKIRLGFVSEYSVGCLISTLSLEGIYKSRSKNV